MLTLQPTPTIQDRVMKENGCIHPADTGTFATGTPALPPILRDVRQHFVGLMIVNGGLDQADGARLVSEGSADVVAFGRMFIAHPDLPDRIRVGSNFNTFVSDTIYGTGADPRGYTDCPGLRDR